MILYPFELDVLYEQRRTKYALCILNLHIQFKIITNLKKMFLLMILIPIRGRESIFHLLIALFTN